MLWKKLKPLTPILDLTKMSKNVKIMNLSITVPQENILRLFWQNANVCPLTWGFHKRFVASNVNINVKFYVSGTYLFWTQARMCKQNTCWLLELYEALLWSHYYQFWSIWETQKFRSIVSQSIEAIQLFQDNLNISSWFNW